MRSSRLPSPEHIVKSALLYCFATPQLGPTHCPFKRTRAWDPDAHASLEHDPQPRTRLRTSFHSSASILRLHPIPSHPILPCPNPSVSNLPQICAVIPLPPQPIRTYLLYCMVHMQRSSFLWNAATSLQLVSGRGPSIITDDQRVYSIIGIFY